MKILEGEGLAGEHGLRDHASESDHGQAAVLQLLELQILLLLVIGLRVVAKEVKLEVSRLAISLSQHPKTGEKRKRQSVHDQSRVLLPLLVARPAYISFTAIALHTSATLTHSRIWDMPPNFTAASCAATLPTLCTAPGRWMPRSVAMKPTTASCTSRKVTSLSRQLSFARPSG
eukprot:scaffold2224_cov261-Pinguiococcus_pyrenoidosus.AAC.23